MPEYIQRRPFYHTRPGLTEVVNCSAKHRLVCAGWLEEQGDTSRPEFNRMQCARSRLPQEDPRCLQMFRRGGFLRDHTDCWLRPLRLDLGAWHFLRGFLQSVTLPASLFLPHHRLLFRIAALQHLLFAQEPGGLKGADDDAETCRTSASAAWFVSCWPAMRGPIVRKPPTQNRGVCSWARPAPAVAASP